MTLEPSEVADLVAAVQLAERLGLFTTERANLLLSRAYLSRRQAAVFRLELTPTGPRLSVDGAPLHAPSRAALVLWWVLAGRQVGAEPIRAEWVWNQKRPAACATQALRRAAAALEPVSPALARVALTVGTRGGALVLQRDPGRDVEVALSVTSA